MHFHDNQRKVDYVLAYHYRKRGVHPGHGSAGHSLAIVSNGETGKEPHAGGPGDMELGPLDALEEERKEQREEFEHNLMDAGLELEKDVEVRLQVAGEHATGWPAGLGWRSVSPEGSLGFVLAGDIFFFNMVDKPDFLAQRLEESWHIVPLPWGPQVVMVKAVCPSVLLQLAWLDIEGKTHLLALRPHPMPSLQWFPWDKDPVCLLNCGLKFLSRGTTSLRMCLPGALEGEDYLQNEHWTYFFNL